MPVISAVGLNGMVLGCVELVVIIIGEEIDENTQLFSMGLQ
jgi:hypothetical protein